MKQAIILVLVFFMLTSLAMAKTHHKKKHPKPTATPTSQVQR